jgi:ribosomal-protein-alanine N-acetyltransferase
MDAGASWIGKAFLRMGFGPFLARLSRFGRAERWRIEPLTPAQASAVSHLHGASFARGWDQPEVARMLADAAILSDGVIAEGQSMPAGFVMSRIAADEAEILTICLDARRRGAGLGARLLDQHMNHLSRRGVARLFLEVEEGNAPALALYRRRGFSEVGARPGYYPMPDGTRAKALILRRDLG